MQNLIVALIVLAAAAYALARLLPAALRQKLLYLLARRGVDQARLTRWFGLEASCGSGCGSCGACADDSQPDDPRIIRLHRKD